MASAAVAQPAGRDAGRRPNTPVALRGIGGSGKGTFTGWQDLSATTRRATSVVY